MFYQKNIIQKILLLIISISLMNLSLSSNLTPLSTCLPGTLSFLTSTNFQNKCNIERDQSQINSYYIFPISLTSNFFNINQCGICYEIVGNKGVIRTRVEDLYTSSDFNVNNIKTISEGLNFVITDESNNKISFRMVACDYNTNIKIKLGNNINNNYISFIVLNNNIGIKEIRLMEYGNPTWNQMARNENNNFWVYNKSTGNLNFPLTINIYSITDENVIININSLESNKEYESSKNFKITDNYYFDITDKNLNKKETTTEFKNTKCCKLDTGSNTSTNNNGNSNTNSIIYQNGRINEDNFEISSDKSEITYNQDSTIKIKYNSNGEKAQFIIKTKQSAIKTSDYKGITFNMKYNQKCNSLCKLKFIIENKEENEINIEESNINSMINYKYEFSPSINEINTFILDFFYFSYEAFELELNDIQLIANNNNDNSNTNNEGLCFNSQDIITNVETYMPLGNLIKIKNIKIYDKEPNALNIETDEFNLNNGQKIVLSLITLDNSYKIDITNCATYTSSQKNIKSFKCYINNHIDDNIYNINSNSGNIINFFFDKNIQVKNGVFFIGNDNLLLTIFFNLKIFPIIIVHSKEEIVQRNQRIIFDIYPISVSKYNGEPEEIFLFNENSTKSLVLKSCEAYKVENGIIYNISCIVSNNILIGNYTTLSQNNNDLFLLSGQSINIICNESNGGILINPSNQTIILGNFTKSRHYNLSLNLNVLYNSQNLKSGDEFPYKVYLLGNKKKNNIRRLQPYNEDYDTIITFKNCTLGDGVYENGVNTFENINCLFPDKVRAGTYNKIESEGLDFSPDNKNMTIIFEKDYDRNALSSNGEISQRNDDDDDSSSDKTWIIWVILAVLLVILVALIIMLYLKKRREKGKIGANNDTTVVKKSSESFNKSNNTTSNEIK